MALIKSSKQKQGFALVSADKTFRLTCADLLRQALCQIEISKASATAPNQTLLGFNNSIVILFKNKKDHNAFRTIWPEPLAFRSTRGKEALSENNEKLFFQPEFSLTVSAKLCEVAISPVF